MSALGLHHDCAYSLRVLGTRMLDLFYILIAVLFFLACWAFTRACDRL
jgi:hypothetical protein